MIPEQVQAALGRMEYLLTYSLVIFLKGVVDRFFSAKDLIHITLTCVSVTSMKTQSNTIGVIFDTVHNVFSVLLVDTVMGSLRTPNTQDTSLHQGIMYWVSATAAVILFPVIIQTTSRDMGDRLGGSRLEQLLFFMYAENSAFLTQDLEINRVVPAVGLIALQYIEGQRVTAGSAGLPLSSVIKATCMVLTNVVITTLLRSDSTATDGDAGIAWLVSLLVLFDSMREQSPHVNELRDYTVWKAADTVRQHMATQGMRQDTALFVSTTTAYVFLSIGCYVSHTGVIGDMSLLVAVNTVLDTVKAVLTGAPHSIVWLVLMTVLCTLHVAMQRPMQPVRAS
jgi:hypothetical protein